MTHCSCDRTFGNPLMKIWVMTSNTVLHWLVEAAEQLRAFSASFLCEVHGNHVQRDELYAVLREVKDGDLSEDEAMERLERSPHRSIYQSL
jgi:hypothetical protein